MESSLGEMAALGKLFEEHRTKLAAMVRRRMDPRLAQRVDAEEIVNEAFVVARRRQRELQEQPSIAHYFWLYRIVFDCLLETFRRESRDKRDLGRDRPMPSTSSAQLAMSLVHSGTSPSHAFARQEMAERMQKTLDMLSNRDQEVLWMRHYDQLSHREAADILGITESAATVRYVRALERLRKVWEHLYGDLEMP